MNSNRMLAILLSAGLSLSASGCKKEEAKSAAVETAKADDKKADDKAAAKPAEAPVAAAAKAEAPKPVANVGVMPDQIATLKKMMEDNTADGKVKAAVHALQLIQSAKLNADGTAFEPEDQEILGLTTSAVGIARGVLRVPAAVPATDAEMAHVKAELGTRLAESMIMATAPVKAHLTEPNGCMVLVSEPAALAKVDAALNTMLPAMGFNSVFDCVMLRGPMELAMSQQKQGDQWGETDRRVAVFIAQKDPKNLAHVLEGWMGFKGKIDKLPDAIVDHFGVLDNNAKNYGLNMLAMMCAKDQANKLIDQMNASNDDVQKIWAKGLADKIKACK